jgi:hypothetical protein
MFVLNLFSVANFAFVHPQGKAAIWIDANPSLEKDGSPFLPII